MITPYGLRDKDDKAISIDVGCFCARDCRSHMCGLRYSLYKVDNRVMILQRTTFNY